MTIQGTLLNALSSLAAEQRQAAVIANNIANANTAGYVRRELPRTEQLTAGQGTGVATAATQRLGDEVLASAARSTGGDAAYGQRMADALANFTSVVGQPSDGRSLSSSFGEFRSAMLALSASPDNAVAQGQAVEAAKQLVGAFHRTDAAVSQARVDADLAVSRDVDAVNASLERLAEVDAEMAKADARGESIAEYQDQRDLLLADIAKRVPVTIHDGGPGRLVLTTDRGMTLYDTGTVHRLSFTHTPNIQSEMRYGSSSLSAVTVDGMVLRSSSSGSIKAGLALRDEVLPRYADMLDQLAGNLMQASQTADASLRKADGTLNTHNGEPLAGLFTNGAPAVWDASEPATWTPPATTEPVPGLARTISLNASADPDKGGLVSRMRDGAASGTSFEVSGPTGASDNGRIISFLNALDAKQGYDSVTGLPSSLSLSDAAAQAMGLMQADRASWADRAQTRNALNLQAQQDLTNKTSVNVDEELQRLLLVQQAHAASVQVIQTASSMLDDLISIRS